MSNVSTIISEVVENAVDSVISFTEFVRDFVNDPIGTCANVLSAMWDTIKDPKFWVLAGTSVLVGLGIASCGSIPVGILVTCIATSAVGEAYDLCIVHRFNLDSFFASRGCKTFMEYIGKQIIVIGAYGLKGYLSGKVIERFTAGKGSSTNKLPDNDLIEDNVQDAIEDGITDSTLKGIDDSIDEYKPPVGGGGISATINTNEKTITFGHGGRHLKGTGLSVNRVNQALADEISRIHPGSGKSLKDD